MPLSAITNVYCYSYRLPLKGEVSTLALPGVQICNVLHFENCLSSMSNDYNISNMNI